MKKKFFYFASMLLGATLTFSACSEDNPEPTPDPNPNPGAGSSYDLNYSAENADSWGNYMINVASLLKNDGANLYTYWNDNYKGAEAFATSYKEHKEVSGYPSSLAGVEVIFDKCAEIANEVGAAKIGDPINLYESGETEEALYAVESWFSWHSRDDYTNNIWSIRNSFYGTVSADDNNDEGDIQENSVYTLLNKLNAEQCKKLDDAIHNAAAKIQAIPQPFRNNINSTEAKEAQTACLDLEQILNDSKAVITNAYSNDADNAVLSAIVAQYTDAVVLPTYKSLMEKNAALYEAVAAFKAAPSDANFQACADAWITAREPWEKSEAFLFGPVDSEGLDPNMDSWPLDVDNIIAILESGNFDDIEWDENDDSSTVEAAQNVRGFHTLEFLIFKDGQARKVNND